MINLPKQHPYDDIQRTKPMDTTHIETFVKL